MKTRITNYDFSASTKQIIFLDYPAIGITLDSVLLITHAPSNIIIYNFADSTLGGTVSGNVLTLDYATTAFADTDALLIYYDDVEKDISIHEPIFGTQHLDDGAGNLKATVQKYVESPSVFKAVSALNQEVGIYCSGYATVVIDISGTFVGTLALEAFTGSSWVGIMGSSIASGVVSYALTNSSPSRVPISGMTNFRLRATAWTSGVAIVVLKATTAPFTTPVVAGTGAFTTQDINTPQLYGTSNAVPTALNGAALVRPWQEPLPLLPSTPVLPATYPNNYLSKLPQYYSRLRVEAGGDQKLPLAQDQNTNILRVTDDDNFQLLEAILCELKTQTLIMAEAFNISPQTDLTNI